MRETCKTPRGLFRVFMMLLFTAVCCCGIMAVDCLNTAEAEDSLPSFALVKGTNVRVRTAPSLNAKEIMQVSGGYVLAYGDSVESDGHNWYKVKLTEANGKVYKSPVWGWISDKFITDDRDDYAKMSKAEEFDMIDVVALPVKGVNVRIRKAPSLSAKEVIQVSNGFVFVGSYTNPVAAEGHSWCPVIVTEIKGKKLKKPIDGWISQKFLDGKYFSD